MKTKEERKRCKKGHETTIGKIIYGFLLFLPLLAIGVTCGYAMFNKNAYQSYEGQTTQTIEHKQQANFNVQANNNGDFQFVTQTQTLPQQTNTITINFNNKITTYNSNSGSISGTAILGFNIDSIQNTNLNAPNNAKSLLFYTYTYRLGTEGQRNIAFCFLDYEIDNTLTLTQNLTYFEQENAFITFNRTNDINIYASHINYYFKPNTSTGIKEIIYNTLETNNDLSNVFYYSIDKITQSPLFNWSQNSIIYTGMSNFTTALSITNTFVPTLLTYWLIISIVYFMYDIVLMMLTILHRKIHDLQDSL